MFKKNLLTIVMGKDRLTRVAKRCFECGSSHIVMLCEGDDDLDYHDIWLVTAETIELVGTLTKGSFKQLYDVGLSKRHLLDTADFAFLQPHYSDFNHEVRRVSMGILKVSYRYHEVCKCGTRKDEPTAQCPCD